MLGSIFTACGNSEQVVSKAETASDAVSSGAVSGTGSTDSADTESQADDGDITDIVVKFINSGGNVTDSERIMEKVNEIAEAKIGVHVNAEWIDIGSWGQQAQLLLSSGERVDLMSLSPIFTLSALVQQKQLMDLTDLIPKYAPDAAKLTKSIILSTTMNGKIYGIPRIMPLDGYYGIMMNKEILDEMGLTEEARAITTWSGLEALLMKVHEAHPEMAAMYASPVNNSGIACPGYDFRSDNFSENSMMDVVGDNYNLVYTNPDTGKIESYFDSDVFDAVTSRASDWYAKGLIYKDGATTKDDGYAAMRNKICFSETAGGSGSAELMEKSYKQQTGVECLFIPIVKSFTSTFLASMFGYAVPYSAKEPEAALKFVNLAMTDADVQNLLVWGEKDVDYVVNDDGTASFPEGKDANSVGYHSQAFLYGNYFIAHPWEGSYTLDELKEAQDNLNNLEPSKYFGCIADTSSVTNDVTACYNAVQQYAPGLQVGSTEDYAGDLAALKEKINSTGISNVVACYQAAGDAFLAQQGRS